MKNTDHQKLLEVSHLTTAFHRMQYVVEDVSFILERNTITGIIGESGSGKTHLAYAVLQLLDEGEEVMQGDILWKEASLLNMKESELQHIRRHEIGMVFQEAIASFDPLMTMENQMMELLDGTMEHKKAVMYEALHKVGLPLDPHILKSHVFSLSTGMCQRIAVAMALLRQPELVILDEPAASLDAVHRASLQAMLLDVHQRDSCSLLYITHDIASLYHFAQRVIVMYCHEIVEILDVDALFDQSSCLHPYTKGLLDSIMPRKKKEPLVFMKGTIHDSENVQQGCKFAPRCPYATAVCRAHKPEMRHVAAQHEISCFHPVCL